jgi:anhydro-N-acetylmuramic acid kinase
MDSKEQYKVIGLMSGTSLDGVDMACCTFRRRDAWSFSIDAAQTIRYPAGWMKKLSTAHQLPAESLLALHEAYGQWLGEQCRVFIKTHRLRGIDFIASHGHTVFHQPDRHFTFQLGSGHALHVASALPVVYDFRSQDVTLGGQGAPLVPLGDLKLFSDYPVCLNLGGIANLSADRKGKRIAYDIAFVNMGLNYLAGKAGKLYDKNGAMASGGQLHAPLLRSLEKIYLTLHRHRPSLGRELFERKIQPLLDNEKIALEDRLHTFTEAAARAIAQAIEENISQGTVLCTGGGAYNAYLMYRLVEHVNENIHLVVPDDSLVKFKEALVFAFLGVMRVRNEVNCLASVTGARHDHVSGLMTGFK